MTGPHDGRAPVERDGFSYLPRFIEADEADALIAYFGSLHPIWEQRHRGDQSARSEGHARRLTRPVYWLGAWQFACLGYYAEPDHREHRCVRAEPFPDVMSGILQRLGPLLREKHGEQATPEPELLPNTCLINYYGREVGEGQPRDYARLRMHRDGEPGPVVMFNVGQAGLLEFLDPELSKEPELALWTRHRSVTILSGGEYKDRLYHRVSQVRTGEDPAMHCTLPNFELRRVSVSFRHVPGELIQDAADLPPERRTRIAEYLAQLGEHSAHWAAQRVPEAP